MVLNCHKLEDMKVHQQTLHLLMHFHVLFLTVQNIKGTSLMLATGV